MMRVGETLFALAWLVCLAQSMVMPLSWSSSNAGVLKTSSTPNQAVTELVTACQAVQSSASRKRVEECIERLETAAKKNANLRQRVKLGASYRTIWSSVTSSTLLGQLLKQSPNQVLGGDSWQVISKDGRSAENIVHWKLGNKSWRMAGLANLEPLTSGGNGYDLIIKGLEFRVGPAGYIPEAYPTASAFVDDAKYRLFYLGDGVVLENGIGTLKILYNDGLLRISRDDVAKNTYVHLLEPLEKTRFSANYPKVASDA